MKSSATITPFPTPLKKRVVPPAKPVLAITLLTILAPALGGSTQLWAQAVLSLFLATLLFLAPPKHGPGTLWTSLLVGLGLLAIPSFLPLSWFETPPWRLKLAKEFGANLPATYSPQPWLSAEAASLLFVGLIYAAYLLSHDWDTRTRPRALRFYAIGVITLATVALVCHFNHFKVPFWPVTLNSPINFGFFPNRNQTANVLALAGIMSIALAYAAFERKERSGWAWLGAVVLLGIALVIDFSRAGIALFLAGCVIWIIVIFTFSTSRQGTALSIGALAILLTLFFLFGGETLQRFQSGTTPAPADYRLAIHADAWKLATRDPWMGQGLGNFEPVFAMARETSGGQNRAIHPESDWLWVAVEMGWPAVGLLGIAVLYWLWRCFPIAKNSESYLRIAAMVCGIGFVFHGMIDVSGHRPGSAWPAIFLASLALAPRKPSAPNWWTPFIFRGAGIILAAIGCWWLGSLFSGKVQRLAPTTHTLARLVDRMERNSTRGEFAQVLESTSEALRIAPLDWRVYYQQGVAHVATSDLPWVAARDFQAGRFLEPAWVDSCFQEGQLWVSVQQYEFAIEAWTEALRRAGPDAPALYARMLAGAGPSFSMHTALQEVARTHQSYLLEFLQYADRFECDQEIGRLIDSDPELEHLSPDTRKLLFRAWFHRGDRTLLVTTLLEKPNWLQDGWIWVALDDAEHERFERAYLLTQRYATPPALPDLAASKSLAALEHQFRFHPNNFREGLELFLAQRQGSLISDAIETLEALRRIPGHPSYVNYLEAELRASINQWPEAWTAWRRYADERGQIP